MHSHLLSSAALFNPSGHVILLVFDCGCPVPAPYHASVICMLYGWLCSPSGLVYPTFSFFGTFRSASLFLSSCCSTTLRRPLKPLLSCDTWFSRAWSSPTTFCPGCCTFCASYPDAQLTILLLPLACGRTLVGLRNSYLWPLLYVFQADTPFCGPASSVLSYLVHTLYFCLQHHTLEPTPAQPGHLSLSSQFFTVLLMQRTFSPSLGPRPRSILYP